VVGQISYNNTRSYWAHSIISYYVFYYCWGGFRSSCWLWYYL